MWQIIGWIIWGIVTLLGIFGIRDCRKSARSEQGLDAMSGMITLGLWIISILFLVFGWNKLHIIWAAPVALLVIPRIIGRDIPLLSPLLLYATGGFLTATLVGIKKINIPDMDEDADDEDDEEIEAQDAEIMRVEKYKRIRDIARDLTGEIMEHAPKFVLKRSAKDLNMMGRKGIFVFDSEDETNFLMDRCFYDIYWQGRNLVGHFIESEDYRELLEEEKAVVQGMTTTYYSFFEIADVDISDATIELKDLLGDKSYTITDLSMCITAQEGYLLATRIKQVEGIYMMTGAACPFEAEQRDILLEGLTPGKAAARRLCCIKTSSVKNRPRV